MSGLLLAPLLVSGLLLAPLLGLGAFAWSGVGRLLLGSACAGAPVRTVVAEYLIGGLAYATLFGLLAHLSLPFTLAVAVLLAFAALGVWASVRRPRACELRLRLACAAGVVISLAIASATPINPNALDPTTYAYMSSVIFQGGWLSESLAGVPDGEWLRSTGQEGVVTRAPALALLWPAAALGWGLTARTVAGLAGWFLLPTVAALADVLEGYMPLVPRLLLAIGAIGVYNEVTVLVDGQVNQTFALAVSVGAVWSCRFLDSRRAQRVVLGLVGAAVAAGYPEFLAALPLYLVCCGLFGARSVRGLLADGLALTAGWALVQLTTGLRNARFLFEEAAANPSWWPLPSDPTNVGDVWVDVVVERPPPPLLAVLLVPLAWYAWRASRPTGHAPIFCARRLAWLSLAVVPGMAVAWSLVALHGPNPNYATFKLGGWLGPGLFLLAAGLAPLLRPSGRHVLTAGLVVLAAARVLGLAIDTPPKLLLYATSRASPALGSVQAFGAECFVQLGSPDVRDEMAALAASAAAVRGCTPQYLNTPSR